MDDLIGEFITETSENIAVLDSELVKLEQNPNDDAILGNIFRLVHTIKGTCGFLGLPRLESVAHAGENVLDKIRHKDLDVSPEAISLVLEALDVIKGLIEYLAENGTEPEGQDKDLIGRLNHFAETGAILGATAAPAPVVAAPAMVLPEIGTGGAQDSDELQRLFDETPVEIVVGEIKDIKESKSTAAAQDSEDLQRLFDETPVEVVTEKPKAEAPPAAAIQQQAKKEAVQQGLDAKGAADSAALANQSIRVNLDVLENLMQMVGELVLTRNQLLQLVRHRHDNEFLTPIQQLSHITTELQEQVMKTRMQPIGNAWAKFPRLIRDLALELNKKIELRMMGAETELDRQLLELIKDPLTHMVRNSCDHGLEVPADRLASGKSEVGTVTLSAYHEGGHIIIEIVDDGRGINIARVKEKIVKNGMASNSEIDNMTESQIIQYIFKPGFSTAEVVTAVSGRGVGMDVVRTNIEKIGGTIDMSSEFGKGSKFSIKIPLTLAIVSVLIVEAGGDKFALPQINVVELVSAGHGTDYPIEELHGSRILRLRDKLLPLISLKDILKLPDTIATKDPENSNIFVSVIQVGGFEYGLVVDRVFDTEEIVVKPVSSLLKSIPVYSGNTILGDGSVIMILDPNGIMRFISQEDGVRDTSLPKSAAKAGQDEHIVTFLLFRAGEGAPKAVPLELVARLEEIDTQTIEHSGQYPVVQYRDELMRLKTLSDDYQMKSEGVQEVIVFRYDGQMLGMAVEEILDIVEAPYKIKIASHQEGFLGSTVINGKVTDVVDVGKQLESILAPASQQTSAAIEQGPRYLLFVEDSPFFRNLTTPYLASSGFEVTALGSALDALDFMEKPNCPAFDVIVTDIEMPGMDGFEFTKNCKANPAFSHIPIFAFTSTVSRDFIAKSRDYGFNGFINKTDRAELLEAIRKVGKDGSHEFFASKAVR